MRFRELELAAPPLALAGFDRDLAHALLGAEVVVDVRDAARRPGEVLGETARTAVRHPASQRDLAVFDRDIDVRGVDVRILGQPVAQVLEDARVRAPVIPRAAAGVAAGLLERLDELAVIALAGVEDVIAWPPAVIRLRVFRFVDVLDLRAGLMLLG